jgi:hypothetical protein
VFQLFKSRFARLYPYLAHHKVVAVAAAAVPWRDVSLKFREEWVAAARK